MSLSDDAYNCCPFCGGQGYTVVTDSYGEPEQEQCRFCYETAYPLSKRIAELEQELLEERASYEAERQRLRDALVSIADGYIYPLTLARQTLEKET